MDHVLDQLSEPVALLRPAGEGLHENPALRQLLVLEPEAPRVRQAITRAAESVRRGFRAFVVGAPTTVATRVTKYHLRPSRLPRGTIGPDPALVVLVHDLGDELPERESLMERFGLTRRQCDVALCLARRRTNSEVARALSISPHTARRHTELVLAKLGVASRLEVRRQIMRTR